MDNNLVYEWILQTTFTVAARDRSLQSAKPYLSSIINEDDTALDLCCGSGFVSFWLEEQGMEVTGYVNIGDVFQFYISVSAAGNGLGTYTYQGGGARVPAAQVVMVKID